MAIKIDLEKAFDKIEWGFIRQMLFLINIHEHLISLILSCISSSKLAILLNGKPTEYFKPSRGIRQGGPLSPYLFILRIKFLSMLIHHQISLGLWKLIQFSNHGPLISLTLFADDVFLFVKASLKNAHSINMVLQSFASSCGLIVNKIKSIFFFPNLVLIK